MEDHIPKLQPSTSTLVHLITFLVTHIAMVDEHGDGGHVMPNEVVHRLMANSYLEDGAFAREFIQEKLEHWQEILTDCLEAASQAGDRVENAVDARCGAWFAHHLAVALGFFHLPKEKVLDYGLDRKAVIKEAIRFSLRGMGLTDKAIQTHFNPEIGNLMNLNLF